MFHDVLPALSLPKKFRCLQCLSSAIRKRNFVQPEAHDRYFSLPRRKTFDLLFYDELLARFGTRGACTVSLWNFPDVGNFQTRSVHFGHSVSVATTLLRPSRDALLVGMTLLVLVVIRRLLVRFDSIQAGQYIKFHSIQITRNILFDSIHSIHRRFIIIET